MAEHLKTFHSGSNGSRYAWTKFTADSIPEAFRHELAPYWFGELQGQFELPARPDEESVRRLSQGRRPDNGGQLTVRKLRKANPKKPDDAPAKTSKPSGGVRFHFLSVSVPKSISVAALLLLDTRVRGILGAVVRRALARVEQFAAVRLRTKKRKAAYRAAKGCSEHQANDAWVPTAQLLVAVTAEFTSSTGDPQFHFHGAISPCTYDTDAPEKTRLRALQAREIYRRLPELRNEMHADLEQELRAAGYAVTHTAFGPELTVLMGLNKRYSTASTMVETALATKGPRHESPGGKRKRRKNAADALGPSTRFCFNEQRAKWLQALGRDGQDVFRTYLEKHGTSCDANLSELPPDISAPDAAPAPLNRLQKRSIRDALTDVATQFRSEEIREAEQSRAPSHQPSSLPDQGLDFEEARRRLREKYSEKFRRMNPVTPAGHLDLVVLGGLKTPVENAFIDDFFRTFPGVSLRLAACRLPQFETIACNREDESAQHVCSFAAAWLKLVREYHSFAEFQETTSEIEQIAAISPAMGLRTSTPVPTEIAAQASLLNQATPPPQKATSTGEQTVRSRSAETGDESVDQYDR